MMYKSRQYRFTGLTLNHDSHVLNYLLELRVLSCAPGTGRWLELRVSRPTWLYLTIAQPTRRGKGGAAGSRSYRDLSLLVLRRERATGRILFRGTPFLVTPLSSPPGC